jgi:hypothetical protein
LLVVGLVANLGAITYNLPDVGIPPGQSRNTDLVVNDGTNQAAININIDYDANVATPGTVPAPAGYIVRQNILGSGASSQLRVVVYADPTNDFPAGRYVVVSVPWNAVGAAGTSTALNITTLGVSDPTGVSLSATPGQVASVNGRVSVLNAPTPDDITPTAENLALWTSFQVSPYPSFLVNPQAPPFMDVSPNGNTPLTIATNADGTRDGLAGWGSGTGVIPYTANSVYMVDWTLSATAVPGVPNFNQFRLYVRDQGPNAFSEYTVTPNGIGALPVDGSQRTYPVLFEPSDLSANPALGMSLEMDVVDFGDDTNLFAATTTVHSVDVVRFNKPEIDAVFGQVFPVAGNINMADAGVWTQPGELFSFEGLPVDPAFFQAPMQALVNYATTANSSQAETLADPTLANASGFFQEFGTKPGTLQIQSGLVYRQVVSAITPTGSDPNATGTIRMRLVEGFGANSSIYNVLAVGGTPTAPTGSNRPPAEGNPAITYYNYLAYPTDANIAALIQAGGQQDDVIAAIGITDFQNTVSGAIRFSDARIEAAPLQSLLP